MILGINNYKKIARVVSKKPISNILKFSDDNPALFQSAIVFTSASILRPMTLLSSPAKTPERRVDNLYSSSRSIASGAVDLAFSSLLFVPINKAINKLGNKLINSNKSYLFNNQKATKLYKNILNRSLKFATIPVVAYLNFKYLKDISKVINKYAIGKKQ